ncbi:MAG: cyclic nucleotide-binding domain-containing protein [Treponema sp.]|nr:cyclic nucleotide-binding domain-containing protein [Candidatus Treponema caballi]
MKKILVVSANKKIIETVKAVCKKYSAYFDATFFSDTDNALSFIDYELPEIKILDFTSPHIDCHRVVSAIDNDPWLHNGGIIAIVKSKKEADEIESLKNPNILIVQTITAFCENFSRLVRILWKNQQLLFNRGMQENLGGREKGQFVCGNDPLDFQLYITFLVSYLYSTNRLNKDERSNLQTALSELLTNALEHGNCGITSEEKNNWLEKGNNILDLIALKNRDPVIRERKIHFSYLIGKSRSKFIIRDDGDGFDWRKRVKSVINANPSVQDMMSGRGIAISAEMTSNMTYNDKGNEVSFEINNLKSSSNTVPGIMQSFNTVEYSDKEVVCLQNEVSNDLYFIVSGTFAVYKDKKLISILSPNDMFIGEMAFLLNDRRTATVISIGEGKLIRIPKNAFLNLIRKYPHYGLFLSKMLAQRLRKQAQNTVALTKELEKYAK